MKVPIDTVDKGFCFSYWRLSYRRKFLRTLWTIPWALGMVVLLVFDDTRPFGIDSRVFAGCFSTVYLVAGLAQGVYNYRRWQSEKQMDGDS
ncbi:MAG: hypothetical protein WC889_11365 [Myxococcota bacterium]|jgi:hypothetical protein